MKIVYYTQTYFLDCDLPLVKNLLSKGNEVFLFIQLLPSSLKSTLVDIKSPICSVKILNVNVYKEFSVYSSFYDSSTTFVINRMCKIYDRRNLRLRMQFKSMIDNICPDIILCTDFPKSQDFFFYLYRNKLVQLVHDPFPHLGEQSYRKKINRYFSHHFTKCFLMLNQSLKKAYIERYKLDPQRVHVSRLGVYECLWNISPMRKLHEKKTIIFFGRISPYKGIEYLIEAMNLIHDNKPDIQLVVAGGGDLYFDKALYEGKQYIKIVNKFLSMGELYGYLLSSDLAVCPYVDATQSGVIMTAYAACLPVVATKVGGLPEMVEDGITGLLVNPKDVKDLANAILKIVSYDDILNQYKKNVQQAVLHGAFSWDKIADQYIKIFTNFKCQ